MLWNYYRASIDLKHYKVRREPGESRNGTYAAFFDGEVGADAKSDVAREGRGEVDERRPSVRRAGENEQLRTPCLHVRLLRVQRVRRRERRPVTVRVQR